MPLSDYAHWNEDAARIWWEEEGKHVETADDYYDPDDYLPGREYVDHDDSGDECIADGNFSTRDNINWMCDGCEGDLVFVRDEETGRFSVKKEG